MWWGILKIFWFSGWTKQGKEDQTKAKETEDQTWKEFSFSKIENKTKVKTQERVFLGQWAYTQPRSHLDQNAAASRSGPRPLQIYKYSSSVRNQDPLQLYSFFFVPPFTPAALGTLSLDCAAAAAAAVWREVPRSSSGLLRQALNWRPGASPAASTEGMPRTSVPLMPCGTDHPNPSFSGFGYVCWWSVLVSSVYM